MSHLIKELKQNNGKDQANVAKKREAAGKDKPLAILMVQAGRKIAKQRITQTFSPETMITFPPLGEEDGTEEPMVIEAEVGGHFVHRMYVDGGASSEILRRGTLNFRMDELHGCKIAFSVQRNNRKAGCKENQSNPVHNPRNVEVPSDRRNGHTADRGVSDGCAVGSTLTEEGRKKLCGLLRQNLDIFAWKPADMTGVPRHLAEHRLNVCEGCFPARQKKKGQAPERNKAICEEVEKLVNAGIIKEVHYHSWLWLSATENRLEGGIPLRISFQMLSGCIQGIPSNKNGKGRRGKESVYHKTRNILLLEMSFGLKNTGATYQRLVDKAFQKQIGRNLEAYVDDLVIKSCMEQEVIWDVEETFRTIRKINIKLNPKTCTFGMKEGVFLGRAKTKRKIGKSQQTTEAETAFWKMKESIAELHMMVAPQEKEELIIYLAAAKEAISVVLVTERDEK
ncbi:hypothetical protein Tco_1181852 [Tanacetum coccineum]